VQAAISVTVSMRANCWFGFLPQRPCRASSPAHESTDLQTNFCVLRLEGRNGRSYSTGRCTQDWMADRNASSHTRRLVTRTAQEVREYRLVPAVGYPSACERPCHREKGGSR